MCPVCLFTLFGLWKIVAHKELAIFCPRGRELEISELFEGWALQPLNVIFTGDVFDSCAFHCQPICVNGDAFARDAKLLYFRKYGDPISSLSVLRLRAWTSITGYGQMSMPLKTMTTMIMAIVLWSIFLVLSRGHVFYVYAYGVQQQKCTQYTQCTYTVFSFPQGLASKLLCMRMSICWMGVELLSND